jgi:hypothetical protein
MRWLSGEDALTGSIDSLPELADALARFVTELQRHGRDRDARDQRSAGRLVSADWRPDQPAGCRSDHGKDGRHATADAQDCNR